MDQFVSRGLDNLWKVAAFDTYMIGHKGFIAGGCFKNLFNGEKLKDIDIFFNNKTDYQEAVSYYDKCSDYNFYYESKKVRAYKKANTGVAIELINSFYGTPEEIIKDFDFTITKIAYFKETAAVNDANWASEPTFPFSESNATEETIEYRILHHKDFFEHLFFKRLVIDSELKFPNSTFERALKYKGYGYGLCKESKLKLIEAIKNSQNPNDQLTESLYDGVD